MRDIGRLHERAENMRKNPTFHEKKFAERMQLAGLIYQSQKVIGNYIVDFTIGYTIIEIDGYSHFEAEQAVYDKQRTQYLEGRGYRVIRVRNEHVVSFDMGRLKGAPKKKKRDWYWEKNHREKRPAINSAQGRSQSEIKEILARRHESKKNAGEGAIHCQAVQKVKSKNLPNGKKIVGKDFKKAMAKEVARIIADRNRAA